MARRLFTVEDRFLIRGRGVIVVPGITPIGAERFTVGAPLELRRPGGTALRTRIAGMEFPGNPQGPFPVLLPVELLQDDVPIGTEVWSAE